MATVYIIGAGLAGLACAVRLTRRGRHVAIFDSAPHAGGRCRSFFDRTLGQNVDNGNHLLLSANRSALAYLDEIGAADTLISPPRAAFPFVDLATGERWTVRPNRGPLPWWIISPSRRIPSTKLRHYLAGWRLAVASSDQTVEDCIDPHGPLFHRFWEPMTRAVLNTTPAEGSAQLLRAMLIASFARGEAHCRPLVARAGLASSFIDPALALLRRHGVEVRLNQRLRKIDAEKTNVRSLDFGDRRLAVERDDAVVLATPPSVVASLLPNVPVPNEGQAIVNAHFRLEQTITLPDGLPFLGILGGTAQWVFVRDDIVSVTVSAAEDLAKAEASDIAARLWSDAARALDLDAVPQPPSRIIKERRATFAQTPDNVCKRSRAGTMLRNLVLAGDWTDTGLPATIDGAIQSGQTAAQNLLNASHGS